MLHKVGCIVSLFTLLLVDGVPTATINNNHVIGYPEVEENLRIKNKDGRFPIYVPSMCLDNELYYPGDQPSDWICDCRPAYLYHPETNKCWPSWRQGPCPEGQYLVLTASSAIPVCRKNPCVTDGYVMLNKKCTQLGSAEVCKHLFPIDAVLGVNATTLLVECVRLSLEIKIPTRAQQKTKPAGDIVTQSSRYEFLTPCSPGSKRKVNGQCEDDS